MPRPRSSKRKLTPLQLALALVIVAAAVGVQQFRGFSSPSATPTAGSAGPTSGTTGPSTKPSPKTGAAGTSLADAIRAKRSDAVVEATVRVTKVLPDDSDGARHQKFLILADDGTTVLIAHNLDLARRVPLKEGDTIQVRGEYEWDERGGVIHWTHHDPRGKHPDGWIRHEGKVYR